MSTTTDFDPGPPVVPAGVPGPDGRVRSYPIYADAYDLIYSEWLADRAGAVSAPPAARESLDNRIEALVANVTHLAERVADLEQAVAEQIVEGTR